MNTSTHLPVIYDTDAAIIGGGLAALTAAIFLREQGHRVLMIVKETYLFEDLRIPYFINPKNLERHIWYRRIFSKNLNSPDELKLYAEELLIKSGVEYVYVAVPLDVSEDAGGNKLLRVAGKFGICGVICRTILDLTGPASCCDRMLVDALNGPVISAEQKLSIADRTGGEYEVTVRPGPYGKGHITIDLPLKQEENHAERALQAFHWIKENYNEYRDLELCRFFGNEYSSGYNPSVQIDRGICAASALNKKFRFHRPASLLPIDQLEMISNNTQFDFFEPVIYKKTPPSINKIIYCQAVVAGGGTAGVMAALYLARQGVKTVLVELNGKLGGTSTTGGVSTYWFGKRHKETIELDERIQKHYNNLGLTRKPGIWSQYDDFNSDLKAYTLKEMCDEAGVEVLFNAICFAAFCEKDEARKIKGIALSVNNETIAILSEYVIDTTGDGDIAAFSGAAFKYGSDRDAITYWASLAQYTSPNSYKNNFSSTVVVSDPKDYTRFITAGRRRGGNLYDHGIYVAPRESRHIKGLYEVTLKDVVTFKQYPDTIYTCFSNYDPKGKLSSDMVYIGILPPQNSVAVPLRALLPVDRKKRRIEGLLVGGKAIYCTHNAFPGLRMQPDLQHQGAVLGIIAAEAIQSARDVSELDIYKLQQKIRTITGDTLELEFGRRRNSKELVDAIGSEMRLEWTDFPFQDEVREIPASVGIITAQSLKILPLLESRFLREMNSTSKEVLARFILWHGSDLATDYLLKTIMDDLGSATELPERKGSMMCVQLLPDHGVMAETVYNLNLLAWSCRDDVYQPFLKVLEKLKSMTRDYRDNKRSIYHYVEAFAYVAERRCLKPFIPMLKELLQLPELAAIDATDIDILTERYKILKLSLLRALARCGDISGYIGLMDLMEDACASVSISACMELTALTGRKWGRNTQKWLDLINSRHFSPPVKPVRKKSW